MADTDTISLPAAQTPTRRVRSLWDHLAGIAPTNLGYLAPVDLTANVREASPAAIVPQEGPDDARRARASRDELLERARREAAEAAAAAARARAERARPARLGPEIEWID